MVISEKIKNLPHSPGVYLMKDAKHNIIYVGKSKNLKNRVQSYFYQSKNHSPKVKRLVNHIADLEIINTDTEFEAFMLECQLIKKLQPPYNRQMKNPRTYCYVVIRSKNNNPVIEIVDVLTDEDDFFFGPFHSRKRVEDSIFALKELYKINCTDPFNIEKRPCLNYSLGTCIGVCSHDDDIRIKYNEVIDDIVTFLKGESHTVIDELKLKMDEASERFAFEVAAKYHDKIKLIKFLQRNEQVVDFTIKSHNFVVVEELNETTIKLFLIKGNQLLYKEKYTKKLFKKDIAKIVSFIIDLFKKENVGNKTSIEKEEIDEAQIIYRYLNSSQCEYFTVTEDWLTDIDKQNQIQKFKENLLKLI